MIKVPLVTLLHMATVQSILNFLKRLTDLPFVKTAWGLSFKFIHSAQLIPP